MLRPYCLPDFYTTLISNEETILSTVNMVVWGQLKSENSSLLVTLRVSKTSVPNFPIKITGLPVRKEPQTGTNILLCGRGVKFFFLIFRGTKGNSSFSNCEHSVVSFLESYWSLCKNNSATVRRIRWSEHFEVTVYASGYLLVSKTMP